MIINDDKKDVVVSEGMERNSFSIQANPKAFQVLSNKIYTHKVRAVIRESACNAFDAHVDAGNPEPFDVHLPTTLEPWYSIRDYGTSMDHQTCMNLYSQYFYSTKTKSNDVIGCLGIGSKSPLCLVDSFNVTAFLDGKKRVYSVYNNEEGCPDIALMGESDTEEPNGIEISMQVDGRISEFQDEAVEVFKYFSVLPNINDATVVEHIQNSQETYDFETEDYKLNYSGYGLKAVMGNVAYNIPDSICSMRASGIIKFDIGELSFDPGRENLSLDDQTIKAIKEKLRKIRSRLKGDIIKQIESQPNSFRKSLEYRKLRNSSIGTTAGIGNDDFFKKYELPECSTPMLRYDYSIYDSGVDKTETTNLSVGDMVLYFLKKPRMDRRVRNFIKDAHLFFNNGPGDRYGRRYVYFLTQEQIDEFNIDADLIQDPEEVMPKPTSSSYNRVKRSKVTKWRGSTLSTQSDWEDCEVDQDDEERVYVIINRYKVDHYPFTNIYSIRDIKTLCEQQNIKMPTVYGLKNAFIKMKAFKEGNWISLEAYLKREMDTDKPIKKYTYSNRYRSLMRNLYDQKIPVDKLDQFITIHDIYRTQDLSMLERLGQKTVIDDTLDDLEKEIVDKYPILKVIESHRLWREEHKTTVTDYVNQINQNGEV